MFIFEGKSKVGDGLKESKHEDGLKKKNEQR